MTETFYLSRAKTRHPSFAACDHGCGVLGEGRSATRQAKAHTEQTGHATTVSTVSEVTYKTRPGEPIGAGSAMDWGIDQ